MLREEGFARVEIVHGHAAFRTRSGAGCDESESGLDPFRRAVSYGRLTAHAFKA